MLQDSPKLIKTFRQSCISVHMDLLCLWLHTTAYASFVIDAQVQKDCTGKKKKRLAGTAPSLQRVLSIAEGTQAAKMFLLHRKMDDEVN